MFRNCRFCSLFDCTDKTLSHQLIVEAILQVNGWITYEFQTGDVSSTEMKFLQISQFEFLI